MLIYCITNSITNKSYIGQTRKSLEERWNEHVKEARYRRFNHKFYNAIKKYPLDTWSATILETVSDETLLNEREEYWIAHYNTFRNGYNSRSGGGQNTHLNEEAKEKSRLAQLGEKSAWFGKHHTSKSIERMKAHIKSTEHRQNLSKASKGKPKSEEHKAALCKAWEKRRLDLASRSRAS